MNRLPVLLFAGLIVAVCVASDAMGCPNCKDSLAQNDPTATGLVQGYFWSILFLLAMPFTILAGMSTYFYLLVRQARLATAASSRNSGNPFAEAHAGQTAMNAEHEREELLV